MILVAAIVVIAATVPILGGRLGALQSLRFRHAALLFGALAIQVAVLEVLSDTLPFWVAASFHLASYALALGFLWCNRTVPGLVLTAAGGTANFIAIAANGGVMPASPSASAAAGVAASASFENSSVVPDARVGFLGDIFAWPEPLPLANVFSIGDVMLIVGAAVLIYRATGAQLPLRRRPLRTP